MIANNISQVEYDVIAHFIAKHTYLDTAYMRSSYIDTIFTKMGLWREFSGSGWILTSKAYSLLQTYLTVCDAEHVEWTEFLTQLGIPFETHGATNEIEK
jgi:hypothetical protein